MSKFDKIIYGLCTAVELGSILALAGLGLKRNNDCYKAECKHIDAEYKLAASQLEGVCKDIEIGLLKDEVKELKEKYESENDEEA